MDFDDLTPPESYCHECNEQFDNSFDLIDHTLEDDEDFDPYYLLPNGFRLLLGSLLRFMYHHRDDPEKIALITQSTYVTLFASEMGYDMVDELVENMVVKSELQNFDEELKKLLAKDDDGEGGA